MQPTLSVFGITITTYSLLLVAGLYLGLALSLVLSPRRGIKRPYAFLMAILCLLGGFVGARFLYVLTHLPGVIERIGRGEWAPVFALILRGGLVFLGGLLGGALVSIIMARHFRIPWLSFADVLLPGVAIGQAVGRLGCYFAGCCYGVPSEHFGVVFPEGSLAPAGIALLPTQWIESVALLFLTAILVVLLLRGNVGTVTMVYLLAYGTFRFVLEFFRGDDIRGFWGPFSTSQWIALLLIFSGLFLGLRQRMVHR